jgi:hypothetical protein
MVFAIVLIGSQAAFAAPAAHFPTQVQTPPIQMTGRGYVPAPTPSPHVMEGHFPTAITVPSILMTGNRGS